MNLPETIFAIWVGCGLVCIVLLWIAATPARRPKP